MTRQYRLTKTHKKAAPWIMTPLFVIQFSLLNADVYRSSNAPISQSATPLASPSNGRPYPFVALVNPQSIIGQRMTAQVKSTINRIAASQQSMGSRSATIHLQGRGQIRDSTRDSPMILVP